MSEIKNHGEQIFFSDYYPSLLKFFIMITFKLLFTVLVGLQFSPAESAYLVESVSRQNHWKVTIASFEGKFGKKVSKSQIYKIYKKFKTEFPCHNVNAVRSGRKKTGRSPENIASVKRCISF